MNEIFKTNLRAALLEKEWTQERLARELDASNRTVAGWCLGETLPQPRWLEQIAQKLGRDAAWFYADHSQVAA